ncbi:MAG: hypothetical protein KBC84_05190 [Proteobacteria bacterium]|nr:hypothetical protein [Pseudomonadota bacterium]
MMKKIFILGLIISVYCSSSFAEDQSADPLFNKNSGDQEMFNNYVVGGASKGIKRNTPQNGEVKKLIKQFNLTKNQNSPQRTKEEQLVPDLNSKTDIVEKQVVEQPPQADVQKEEVKEEVVITSPQQYRGAISPEYYKDLVEKVKQETDKTIEPSETIVKKGNIKVKRSVITSENKF